MCKESININKLKDIKDNFYIVIDFNQTITSKTSANSWSAVIDSIYINKEHRLENQRLYEIYKPIETNDTLDIKYRIDKMDEWYSLILNQFYKYEYNRDIIEKAVKESKLKLRDGAKNFFENTYKNNIPNNIKNNKITIAFLDNNIEENLELYNKYFDIVLIDNTSFKEIETLLKIV